MPATGKGRKFVTYEGNTRVLPFSLRRFSNNLPWDVSTATAIQLEVTNTRDQVNLTPIMASSGAPGADWANGEIRVTISPANVTASINTYEWGLTVTIGGEVITVDDGTIEVRDRPGYPAP